MSGGDLLGRFGISRDAEVVWLALIEAGESTVDDLVDVTSQSPSSATSAVEELVAEGLVNLDRNHFKFRATEPTLAVEARLAQAERRLLEELEDLREIRTHLPDLSKSHARTQLAATRTGSFDVVLDPGEIRQHIYLLGESARRNVWGMIRQTTARVAHEALPHEASWAARGVERRSLVTAAMLADSERYEGFIRYHEIGEEWRSLPTLPIHTVIVDGEVVVLPVDPDDVNLGAMFIREPGVVRTVVALFEHLWSTAQPVFVESTGRTDGLPERSARVLELVASGATDDHISRSLGVTTRTVRREIATLRDTLGVGSRAEVVPAAVRRGWL